MARRDHPWPCGVMALLALIVSSCTCCQRCAGENDEAAPARSAAVKVPLEPWALGPVSGHAAVTLPPGCALAGDSLRAVIPRHTRLRSDAAHLGELLVVTGASDDAMVALMRMRPGMAEVAELRWPAKGNAALARGRDRWLVAYHERSELALWRSGDAEGGVLARGETLEAVSARCDADRCAVLARRPPQPAVAAANLSFAGGLAEPASAWRRIELPFPDATPLTVLSADPDPVVAVEAGGRLRIVAGAAAREMTGFDSNERAVAVTAARGRVSALYGGPAGACSPESGGATVRSEGADPIRLMGPVPATDGVLLPVGNGLLALWRAPRSCRGGQLVMFGAFLMAGRPVGPVAVMGDADEHAVAANGDRVDLWLVDDGAVTYVPFRCG